VVNTGPRLAMWAAGVNRHPFLRSRRARSPRCAADLRHRTGRRSGPKGGLHAAEVHREVGKAPGHHVTEGFDRQARFVGDRRLPRKDLDVQSGMGDRFAKGHAEVEEVHEDLGQGRGDP
jgi:hypothetical protein